MDKVSRVPSLACTTAPSSYAILANVLYGSLWLRSTVVWWRGNPSCEGDHRWPVTHNHELARWPLPDRLPGRRWLGLITVITSRPHSPISTPWLPRAINAFLSQLQLLQSFYRSVNLLHTRRSDQSFPSTRKPWFIGALFRYIRLNAFIQRCGILIFWIGCFWKALFFVN